MITQLRDIIAEGNWVLHLNLMLVVLFLVITLGFTVAIIYLRSTKIIIDRKTERLKELFSDFITVYLFDENKPTDAEIESFKNKNITTSLDQKVAIKVLLIFEENFKGDTNESIKELFFKWNLSNLVERDLESGKWYKVARAIYIASELNLARFHTIIERFIDSERDELKQQAILYFIHLSESEPLSFFDKIKKPLTLWEQIYIEECLKSNYTGEIPDFSRWLDSSLTSLQSFSIKMIGEYNQYENLSLIIPFLKSEEEDLRREAIRSLGILGYPELMKHFFNSFSGESPAIKSYMLKIIRKIGSFDDLRRFGNMIPADDWNSKQVYFKLQNNWNIELQVSAV